MFSNSFEQTIYAFIVACALPIFLSQIAKLLAGFKIADNANPRAFMVNASGMAARADAAHKNGFEVLPFFVGSLCISLWMVIPQIVINQLAWYFVILRILYSLAYIFDKSTLRTCLWVLSMVCPLMLLNFCLEV